MKLLPLGRQDFATLIEDGCLYVDKTPHIYNLLRGKYYFLSRPRRFGKSLLLSTIEELFLGNRAVFQGLWIEDKHDWSKTNPVLKISFNTVPYKDFGLRKGLEIYMLELAKEQGIKVELDNISPSQILKQLIKKLAAEQGRVVILIDEYDKPIIDYVDDVAQAEENRDTLKSFYAILKDLDKHIRFLFITGVSKFSKVSIFSDLNNLEDITLDQSFNDLLGITEEELERYFSEYIHQLGQHYSSYFSDIREKIKDEYLGYSWGGENRVYNPFSLLNLFKKKQFNSYWFQSGTPTFLMKLIREQKYTAFELEDLFVFRDIFDKYEVKNISLISLLFQTGYLTILEENPMNGVLHLGYPNKEVGRSFTAHLIANMNGKNLDKANVILYQLTDSLESNDVEKFMQLLSELFKSISYPLVDKKESTYHSVFFLVIKMLGFNIESEIMTIDGRIDCVMKTKACIYVIEFKTGNTKKAITQIREKGYHQKYFSDSRAVKLLGIDFDAENKQIADWVLEDA